MRNIKLTIEYKGTNYFGWQKQKGKPTIQAELEKAILSLTNETVVVEGSGRTDSGVHAKGQVANFFMQNPIPISNLKRAMNDLLPKDIRVLRAEEVGQNFHARFSAKEKTYQYIVQVGGQRSALKADGVAFYEFPVNFEKMQNLTKLFVGEHDFQGFCNSDATVSNFVRKISKFHISKRGRIFKFEITGNGFLYNMVRIIVGTLLDYGRGQLAEEDINKAFSTKERRFAGRTMEACGLYLKEVKYARVSSNKKNDAF